MKILNHLLFGTITLLLSMCIILGSCSTGENAATATAKMFGGSSQALLFINCRAVSEDEIEFEFSQAVTVKSLSFEPALTVASVEEGSVVKVRLEEIPRPGIQITADILAEDADRNTINVLVPFRSRNNNMPSLVINELCTEWSKPKTEFIEFKTLSAGNIGGMRVVINGNTNAARMTLYEFLPAEVKKDEYIVLHLRTVEEGCISEYGQELDESGGKNASATARDLWLSGNTKLVHKAATAVYVMDQDDRVLDAIMISETPVSWWQKDYLAETADMLFAQGAWKSADGRIGRPADSIISSGTTNTRTICRDETTENSHTAADWYITDTSCATPGKPNNPKRYSK
jgi:hypothetical protein